MAYAHARNSASPSWSGKMAAKRDPISQQFHSEDEREIARDFAEEIRKKPIVCLECMNRLVLANVQGHSMEAITDIASKAPRYGGLTERQHSFMASVMTQHHLPKLLQLIANETETGESTVENVPAEELSARERERLAGQERLAAKRAAYFEKRAELARIDEAAPTYDTEDNPMFGAF